MSVERSAMGGNIGCAPVMSGQDASRPAPVGPQLALRACQWIEGGALGSPARCGRCKEEPDCLFAHGSFRQTGATGLALAQGGHAGGLGPNPLPAPRQGLPSQEPACQLRHRTVPAPTLRRLASAPLVRTKLSNDIAELTAKVKNKDGTRLRTRCVIPGRSDSAGEGNPWCHACEWIPFPRRGRSSVPSLFLTDALS